MARLTAQGGPMTKGELLESFNVRPTQIESLRKNLEVDGAIERVGRRWIRTLRDWSYDHERVQSVTAQRITEQGQMLEYIGTDGCRVQLLGSYLDDDIEEPCGICDNRRDSGFDAQPDPATVQRGVDHLRRAERIIEPRQGLPVGGSIPLDHRHEPGRSLSVWGDGGWGNLVRAGKQESGRFDDQLVGAAAELITSRRNPEPAPTWVTFVPSRVNPGLVADYASRLAAALRLPCEDVVAKTRDTEPQKTMQNSSQQFRNVQRAFAVRGDVPPEPVLLVDDIVDSRWTVTVVDMELREAGAGPVFPLVLADTAGRSVQ